jgi:2-keto-4-pentenoate hydratase/2-oxohepta-3-ene-1,7-dioic acid hydratase in catechol pathway
MRDPRPTKIVCIGLNYVAHAAEFGNPIPDEPLMFLKPPSAVIGPGEAIVMPKGAGQVTMRAR